MTGYWYEKTMAHHDVAVFFNELGTSVLRLVQDRRVYGTPVGFGYDGGHDRMIFDLGFALESRNDRSSRRLTRCVSPPTNT